MAEKGPKAKAKPKSGEPSVLGTLPATRPERIGAPRGRTKKHPAKRAANGPATRHHGTPAVRPGSPPLRPHRGADAPPPRPIAPPTGTELVTTAIRATG